MRVVLISSNTESINMVTMPLGLSLVAEATRRAGHDVLFLDLLGEENPAGAVRRALSEHRPDVIGVSVRNIDDQEMSGPRLLLQQVRPVIEACRASCNAPVVLGGAGYSIFPDDVLVFLGADFGVVGDGEVAFPALLGRMEKGEDPSGIPGLHVAGKPSDDAARADAAADLDALPLPGPDLGSGIDPQTPDLWVPVQSRRGCPNDCSYCSTFLVQGRKIRTRSPRLVAEGIDRMARAGFRRFYIVDNSFNLPESHGLELCGRLKDLGRDIRWRCILYPQHVGEDLVRAMSEAGCAEVALGFESGCLSILRRMNKRFTPDEVREISGLLASHGIRRMGFLLLGGPGETRESVEESLAFARSLDLDMLRITVGIRIYPGTPLAGTAVDEGLIDPHESLLIPKFYLAPGLDPWIHERVKPGMSAKPPGGRG
jgi:radical SAM superfamily enzyme YgiQ (UPF0313 family)